MKNRKYYTSRHSTHEYLPPPYSPPLYSFMNFKLRRKSPSVTPVKTKE